MTSPLFQKRMQCVLFGLKKAEWNLKRGVIEGPGTQPDRLAVKLQGKEKPVSVKISNIMTQAVTLHFLSMKPLFFKSLDLKCSELQQIEIRSQRLLSVPGETLKKLDGLIEISEILQAHASYCFLLQVTADCYNALSEYNKALEFLEKLRTSGHPNQLFVCNLYVQTFAATGQAKSKQEEVLK